MPGVVGDIPPPDRSGAAVFDLTARLPAGVTTLSEPQVVMAETVQSLFLHRGQSLADPPTAAVYRTSMELVGLLLAGALATGELGRGQYATLKNLVDGAAAVPGIL
ncbi:MAG: hypothetical protein JWO67_1785 [Streptosporangiaceae bacterium]|nr:hypothetical protein [Streptosporangiaceae bacterium]